MSLGRNVHNAVAVVFKTLQSIEKLMIKIRAELDEEKYYMPADRFMRYNSDVSWEGWIYWSFILLFQRKEDGEVMENGWINGPVYAVEINIDSDTCDEPELIVAKMNFGDISDWNKGCSPSNHTLFYDAIHANKDIYEVKSENSDYAWVGVKVGSEENTFWGFENMVYAIKDLMTVNQGNYKDKIFGTIEELSKVSTVPVEK